MSKELEHSHHPEAIRRRLAAPPSPSYLRDSILGGIDGCVTTIAVVASVAGAGLPGVVAFVLGLSSLVADGFSMAVSNYQAVKSDHDARARLRAQEDRHIRLDPGGEREEIRQIFRSKGFDGEVLEQIVETLTADERLWIDTMIREEHGLALQGPSPLKAGAATFAMFLLVGATPLLPFLIPLLQGQAYFLASAVAAAVALFGIGWAKGRVLGMARLRAGLETLLMGGGAAVVAFVIGVFLEPMLAELRL
ncbi:VIT1/CCC1 transporter family protein [Aquisalimonas asiatica]|uniref:Predicted Fe2+/Mn2+ transporter, VIT1/CCC1 family n=1 Tax=Aquisalimonas asiatica TaxID=406100 RepID=A0A1H8UMS5_9GAMM|nr:VIT1/CCC1 transporter family protein [Aquisalimonas asiatica]SEP04283.1 Predicted Fe2+/Mn2+ transporter, VIT1/CCC1 family [Aquisalimonas asiatica]